MGKLLTTVNPQGHGTLYAYCMLQGSTPQQYKAFNFKTLVVNYHAYWATYGP